MDLEYQVKIVQDVTSEPVTLSEAKAWAQIDADYAAEDTIVEIMITSAREKLEQLLNVALAPKTLEVQFSGGCLILPFGPTGEILSFFNVGDDPYEDTDYTLHGLTFKTLVIGSVNESEWFYPQYGGSPRLWRNRELNSVNTYNVIYTTGYSSDKLPRALKEALLIQIDWDLKTRGVPSYASMSPVAVQKAAPYSKNLTF